MIRIKKAEKRRAPSHIPEHTLKWPVLLNKRQAIYLFTKLILIWKTSKSIAK